MSNVYGPNLVRNGLVLLLDAANTRSYPGSGTTWSDLSGNGYNATLVNGPTVSSSGVELDGNDDYIAVSHSGDLAFTSGNFTIAVWHNYSGGTGYGGIITNDSSGDAAWKIKKDTGQAYFRGQAYNHNVGFPSYTLDTFHYYVMTQTPSLLQLYFNGVAGNSVTVTTNPNSANNIAFGSYRYDDAGNGNYLNNQTIGLTEIYNRALTAAEVLQNFEAHKGRFGL